MVTIEDNIILCFSCGKTVEALVLMIDDPRNLIKLVEDASPIAYEGKIAKKVDGLICRECFDKTQDTRCPDCKHPMSIHEKVYDEMRCLAIDIDSDVPLCLCKKKA